MPSGTDATFSVAAEGVPDLQYQWQHRGAALPGETGAILIVSGTQPNDAGDYAVVVTSFDGSVTSETAQLRVLVAPTLTAVEF